jgi:hypothetical protein
MADAVRLIGLDELDKSFRKMRKEVLRELRPQLRKAGEVVRAKGQSLFSPISPKSAAGYKVRVRQRGVAVEQTLPRVTGLRPDFGALQMNRALLPALASSESQVTDMIDKMIDDASGNADLT